MTFNKKVRLNTALLISITLGASNGCGKSSTATTTPQGSCSDASFSGTTYSPITAGTTFSNVMTLTVDGSTCGSSPYSNEPCVSITLCSPTDPTNCQTVSNLLLDTGSYGLRIFSSAITVPLAPITSGSSTLAECVIYGDGSTQWGQVEYGYVQLGGEPMVGVPIQVINSSYGSPPSTCSSNQDTSPAQAGFNGILGVGLLAQDCGSTCTTVSNNEQYYSCNGSDCSCGATVALTAQVQNPVSQLPVDNNGVILTLPSVSASGAASVSGTLTLGIGTQTNNSAGSGVATYAADSNLNFSTLFSPYSSSAMTISFIDSGSNDLFFPPPTSGALTDCSAAHGSGWTGIFCPSSTQSYSATLTGADGLPTGGTSVSFDIANGYTLTNTEVSGSTNNVFINIGGTSGTSPAFFDWGLPFFLGRTVYVGINGTTSSLGTGPYWAF